MGGGHSHQPQCSMNMLFTWSYTDLCIVFRQWHINGPLSLILSLIAIALLTAGYECVRNISRQYDAAHNARMSAFGTSGSNGDIERRQESSSLLLVGRDSKQRAERMGTIIKALLYAVQVFYSFFIMLLFMTYNGWVMLAVAVGAFIGYIMFGATTSPSKSVACH